MSKNEQLPSQSKICVITPSQLRAARSILDWSRRELAKESGISPETIKNIEHSIFSPQESTIKALVETFAHHNVRFIRYETGISIPTDCESISRMLPIFYEGVVRVTTSMSEILEKAHD